MMRGRPNLTEHDIILLMMSILTYLLSTDNYGALRLAFAAST
jgi:hypothetical protein